MILLALSECRPSKSAMRNYSERLKEKFYGKNWVHPYRIYEKAVLDHSGPGSIILDAGCGREAPVLQKLAGIRRNLFGVDIGELHQVKDHPIQLAKSDLHSISLKSESVNLVISRSVLEHLKNPVETYKEVYRILKPGGKFIFLTPNLYDYASIISKSIPSRFHASIVRLTEGRNEEDTFPTYYRSNAGRNIRRLANLKGFEICSLEYLGQYPSYFMFNPVLFMIGTAYDKFVCRFAALKCLRGWILTVLRKTDIT